MKTPTLRFKGFTDEWKLVSFKTLFSEVNEKTGDIEKYPLYSLTVQDGITKKTDRYNREFLVKKEDNFKIVKSEYFVSNPMNMTIGALARYKGSKDISVSGYYNVFKNISNYKNQFLEDYLKSSKMISVYKNIATGSLIEKQRVHYSQFIELSMPLPSVDEANKISNFMETINEKILLQQEKIDLLKEQRKSYMQKIFNQKLRFKDENGNEFPEWKTNKLSYYLYEHKIRNYDETYSKEDVLSVSGEHGIVNQIAFQGRSFAGQSVANYHVVHKGDIVYTKSPLKSNPYGIIKCNKGINGIVSTLYAVYSCKETIHGEFLDYYFQLDDNTNSYLRPLVNKGAKNDMKVNNETVLQGEITIPSLKEQKKISVFLSFFDKKIKFERVVLKSLIEQKNYFMQQMFI